MLAYAHVHPCSLFKMEENQFVDRSLRTQKMFIVYSSQKKWVFVFSAVLWPFKSFCLALWLNYILVVNNVANCGRLRYSLGHGEHVNVRFPNPCLALKNSAAVKGLKSYSNS